MSVHQVQPKTLAPAVFQNFLKQKSCDIFSFVSWSIGRFIFNFTNSFTLTSVSLEKFPKFQQKSSVKSSVKSSNFAEAEEFRIYF